MLTTGLAAGARWLVWLVCLQLAGAHWTMLQGVAWTKLLADYSKRAGFREGIRQTFDGRHPCCMCKMIQAATSASKAPTQLTAPAPDGTWMARRGIACEDLLKGNDRFSF